LGNLKIADIKPDMRGLDITGRIIEMGEVKIVETKFGPARVAQAILRDKTGSIILNLWRNQIDSVKVGDTIRVENAFVRIFRDQLELNVGRDGKITVVRGPENET